MLPTVAEVLALDPVRRGAPRVLAATDRLDTPVRWVHVIELAEAAHLLRGGELVLSTGIALPGDPGGLARYVADLASVGVSALAVELGSRYSRSLPDALVAAAVTHRLPLLVFERETQFIEITESVHALIIDNQLAELRAAERMHQVFTELAVSGAPADEVVGQAATLAGCPVILENLAHQVLACATAAQDAAGLLAGFATRSRAVGHRCPHRLRPDVGLAGHRGRRPRPGLGPPDHGPRRAARAARPGPAGAGRDHAGPGPAAGPPAGEPGAAGPPHDPVRAGRARLRRPGRGPGPGQGAGRARHRPPAHGRRRPGQRRLGATSLDRDQARGHQPAAEPAPASAQAAAWRRPAQPGLAAQARTASVADATAAACRQLPVPALVASLDDSRVAALLALPPRADPDAVLTRLAAALRPRLDAGDVIGAGSVVESVTAVQRSFLEADQVAEVAARTPAGLPFYRLPDLRLRGLLHLLRDDPRLQAFAERELAPLLRHDHAAGSQLVAALTAYLEAGGNKAEAAKRAHLARPTLYERLRQIEEVLGTSLEPAESRLSLHVALLALEAVSVSARDGRPAP